jgi:hypothetical protein
MEHEIHLEPPSPVRCQGRISFHRVSSAHSEQQPGWGQDSSCSFTPSRRPSQCCIWLVASFLLALTLGTTPWSPTCPPLPCRGSSLGLRRRSQGPRAYMERVVLEARSQSQAFRAEALLPRGRLFAPHRVTIPGGLRPSPFSMSFRNKGHAPERPLPSLFSMCREAPRSQRSPRPPPPCGPVGFSR